MRIRMAVIDDEVFVRKGIISSVDWDSHGIDIAGEATDGISGMELVRRTRPHIVLTDIRMPHVDGLELIRMIKSEFPSARILILSVLEDFQTVREALRLGVVDYVQKLLMTPEALLAAVLEIKASLEAGSRQSAIGHEGGLGEWLAGGDSATFDGLFAEADGASFLLAKIAARPLRQGESERDERGRGEPHPNGPHGGVSDGGVPHGGLLHGGEPHGGVPDGGVPDGGVPHGGEPDRAEPFDGCRSARDWLRRSPDPALLPAYTAPDQAGGCWALIPRHDDGVSRERVAQALRHIAADSERSGVVLTAGLSLPFAEPQRRFAAKEQADAALQRRFYKGDGGVFVYREHGAIPQREGHFVSNEQLKAYLGGLQHDGDEASLLAWGRLFPEEADESFAVEAIREGIYLWLSSVMLVLEERGEQLAAWPAEPSLFEQARLIETYPQLREWCLRLHELVRRTLGRAQPQHRDEIRKAMDYTRSHYREPIKVKDIAEQVNLSENYFSYLFAKETGKPFVQYLQETRIEKAKEWLRDGKLKWYEVTEKVGFESPKYFTKVFKKYNGITPMQYAKENRSRLIN